MEGSVEDFCYWVLDLHKGIRFAGLASSSGRLVSQAYRRGLKPLASKNESESSILSTFAKMDARAAMEKTYGRTVYAFALTKTSSASRYQSKKVPRYPTSSWSPSTQRWNTS